MLTVGITAVGGGVGQAVLSALRAGGLVTRVVGMDTRPLAPGLYWSDAAYLVPPVADQEPYLQRLLQICAAEQVDALIPGLDVEMPLLSRNAAPFAEIGCTIIVGSPPAVDLCFDKLALSRLCANNQFPFVPTYSVAEAKDRVDELAFPVMIKPCRGAASAGARLATRKVLLDMAPSDDLVVQDYLPPTNNMPLMTESPGGSGELVQSEEISAQFFVGPSGAVLGSFVSINRLKHGVPLEIVPIDGTQIADAASGLIAALAALGLRGPINLQGRYTPDGPTFFEANARFTGITGTRALLGYREVDAALECLVLGRPEHDVNCLPAPPPRLAATRHVTTTIVDTEHTRRLMEPAAAALPQHDRHPRRLLVTGAAGYLGSNLIPRLLDMPGVGTIVATTHGEASAAELVSVLGRPEGLEVDSADLTGTESRPLDGVDTVIHCAALRITHPDTDITDYLHVNVEGTRRLLEQAAETGVERFVFISTQAVYGTSQPAPWAEADPPRPETRYGLSKWMAEEILRARRAPPQVVVLRLARLYGLGQAIRWDELPHRFAANTAAAEALPIYGSGNQRMDFLHIEDATRAVGRACSAPLPPQSCFHIFNVGSDRPVSIRQLAGSCRRAAIELGLPEPPLHFLPDAIEKEIDYLLDVRRARSFLGWSPQVSLEEGIRELIAAAVTSG